MRAYTRSNNQTIVSNAVNMYEFLQDRFAWDPIQLTLEGMSKAIRCAGVCIADVLSLYNPEDNTWLTGSPTILRLENQDIALFAVDGQHVALFFGTLNTETPLTPKDANQPSFIWKSFTPAQYAIGRHVSSFSFGTSEKGLLTALEARFDDGGRITLCATGCTSTRAERRAPLARPTAQPTRTSSVLMARTRHTQPRLAVA